ncbi:hypothetical protein Taro_027672 [Colocasia esculenta]|uniref:BED-type domain-containing protein n=1 Tax=Colocasia esculenta TaxID=4460 RepID=A0A843VPH1_COLES|nr:hypothetical protein [Colocasia esculenta]
MAAAAAVVAARASGSSGGGRGQRWPPQAGATAAAVVGAGGSHPLSSPSRCGRAKQRRSRGGAGMEALTVTHYMAPKKGNNEDIGWQHGIALGSRHNYNCNYCGHTRQGGGISLLKMHLAGGRLVGYHDVQGCKSVLAEVQRLMVKHLKGVRAETVRKRANRVMQERIILGRHQDEDDDDEPEIYAEHVPDEPLRRTREQTRVESWEA